MIFWILLGFLILWVYWRYCYFFRDPERKIPKGKNIVSPADGTVIYIKKVSKNMVPISVKNGRELKLSDITKTKLDNHGKYLIGIFMSPFDVHINRSPISGKVRHIRHYQNKILPMTSTWIRCIFNMKPYYSCAPYLLENERSTMLIEGEFPVLVVQIADIYVKKIISFVKETDNVKKGDRIGLIRMGSQVDVVLPFKKSLRVKVKEGDRVKGGEGIIAEY